tara:strand:+ start:270 stop:1328 length:1059 start_codon:yes stop_codon:yes gene_type:complete
MKLFQRLLVAPAALGLMAPLAANADVTTEVTQARLDGIEARVGEIMAGSFSPTTKLKAKVNFTTGSVSDHTSAGDEIHQTYEIKYGLSSSFTGEDKLAVKFESGSGKDMGLDPQSDKGDDGKYMQITDVYYSFPVADDFTVSFGPKMDGDEGLEGTASLYSDKAGVSLDYASLDGEGGAGVTFAYKGDNGFNGSLNLTAEDGDKPAVGIDDEATKYTTAQVGFDGDGFGGAVTYLDAGTSHTALGVGVYFQPDTFPVEVSAYYDVKSPETGDEDTNWAVGVETEAGPGTLGIGLGTIASDSDPDADNMKYEIWYDYKVADGIKITPILWQQQEEGLNGEDESGAALNVGFKF